MKYGLFLIFLLGLSSQALSNKDYPYQNCNPKAEQFTEDLWEDFSKQDLSKTEADFCFLCDESTLSKKDGAIENIDSLSKKLSEIPKECFLAMATRGNRLFARKQYRQCKAQNSTRSSSRKKLCANEKYVEMIQKAFTDMSRCFNFDLERQARNLAIINQESGGILNVMSASHARCMTQLTKAYVADIIKNIENTNGKERQIYDSARQKCPWVSNLILSRRKVMAKNGWLTCQTTRNPHVCLFYKFMGLETNLRNIKEKLRSAPDYSQPKYMGNREFTEEEKEKYKLPLRTNEILNITVEFKELEKGVKTYTFEHASAEMLNFIRNITPQAKKIETKKIPLFKNDEDIQNIFYYWSHNGGSAYAGSRMVSIVEKLKQDLATSCSQTDESARCTLRRQIQKGESLSAGSALPFFEKSIGAYYKDRTRRNEVTGYIKNLINNHTHTFDYDEESHGTKKMISDYKKSVKSKTKGIELSDEDATAFQKRVSEICPKVQLVSP